jgi:hypothetical protein
MVVPNLAIGAELLGHGCKNAYYSVMCSESSAIAHALRQVVGCQLCALAVGARVGAVELFDSWEWW